VSWKNILKMNPSLVVDQIGEHKDILADIEEMFRQYSDNEMLDKGEIVKLLDDYNVSHHQIHNALKVIIEKIARS